MKVEVFTYSEIGQRSENQDSWKVYETDDFVFACVADGVGGANCGKMAAAESTDFFGQLIANQEASLEEGIQLTHQRIKSLQNTMPECRGMGTTFTGCLIREGQLQTVQVGDSRLCILRKNGIKQLTESHTEVERLLKAGKLRLEDVETYPRKNILESALGINGTLTSQFFDFSLSLNDRILLTTDGVHNIINKLELRNLSVEFLNHFDFGNAIVKLLNERRLTDNATFILISIIELFPSTQSRSSGSISIESHPI